MKYMIDKKYHNYWNILCFYGLSIFIFLTIKFLIFIIMDPYNNNVFLLIRNAETKFIILHFLIDVIISYFLKMLFTLLILEYFSLNHVLISHLIFRILFTFYQYVTDSEKLKLLFLIPAVFLIFSLLLYLEILEFNFCNLNKNTKRNIMLREEEEMLLRNNTNASENEIEVDKDLIIKNPQVTKDLELYDLIDDSEEKKAIIKIEIKLN